MSDTTTAAVLGGRTGLLGQTLCRVLEGVGWRVVPLGREDADVLAPDALAACLARIRPHFVFNAVAYTQVDKAQEEPEQAHRLNEILPACLGRLSREQDFRLIHYSTDFVFDGKSQQPYTPTDRPHPLGVYGQSKLAGENALLELGLSGLCLIRTAWLFGPGRKNFVATILDKAGKQTRLGVVHDQVGSPTYTPDLAWYSYELARRRLHGVFHVVNAGQASWCELAAEAVQMAGLPCQIDPIPSSAYPQKARRPAFSVLSTEKFTAMTGVVPRPWVQGLREYVCQHFAGLKPKGTAD